MGDKLILALQEQGFTAESALEYLKGLQATEQAKKEAKSGDPLSEEKLRNIIDDVVGKQMEALNKGSADNKKVTGGEGNEEADAKEMREMKNDLWLLGHMLQRSPRDLDAEAITGGFRHHLGKEYKLASVRKALDTTQASAIVPTDLAREMLADVEKSSVILDNLRVLNMPTNPWEAPYQSSSMTLYGVDESTEDDASAVGASDPGAEKLTYTAKKVGARTLWSQELDEDSAIAILPLVREDFVRIIRDGWERNFIFGDERTTEANLNMVNTGGHTPTTTAGAKDHWLQTDGLVKFCLVTHTDQANDVNAVISASKFLETRAKMGKYGDRPQDLLVPVTRDLLYDMMGLEEVKTLEKYGAQATVLTGELARFYGSPVVVSDGLPKTAAAGGISRTGGDNVKKSFLIINRVVGASIGRRGELRIAVDKINKTDQYEGVVFSRYDIQFPFAKGLAYGYNIGA